MRFTDIEFIDIMRVDDIDEVHSINNLHFN